MDAAEYEEIAAQLGACEAEQLYELACARYDLRCRPETVHGRDEYEIAADAMTAFRALPARPPQKEVHFPYHAWTPGNLRSAAMGPPPHDRMLEWWKRHIATQKAAGRF